ncbi:hypothetical protein ACFWN2_20300 [Lentzea sp. NPDC058436]
MGTGSHTLGGITTEGSQGMRRTSDRIGQWVAFAVLAAAVITVVVLGLSL